MAGLTFGWLRLASTRLEVRPFHPMEELSALNSGCLALQLLSRKRWDVSVCVATIASEYSVSPHCLMIPSELFWLLSLSQIKAMWSAWCSCFHWFRPGMHLCNVLSIGGFYLNSQFFGFAPYFLSSRLSFTTILTSSCTHSFLLRNPTRLTDTEAPQTSQW